MKQLTNIIIAVFFLSITACVTVLPTADNKMKNKEYVEASTLYEQHLSENPNDTETKGKLGFAYLKTGKFEPAKRSYSTLLSNVLISINQYNS